MCEPDFGPRKDRGTWGGRVVRFGERRGSRPLRVCGERGRLSSRPVLKHGPRSPARARVAGFYETRGRSESEVGVGPTGRDPAGLLGHCSGGPRAHRRPVPCRVDGGAERERACRDPKDGELRLGRAKPGETPVEARSDSDVQIDRPTRA